MKAKTTIGEICLDNSKLWIRDLCGKILSCLTQDGQTLLRYMRNHQEEDRIATRKYANRKGCEEGVRKKTSLFFPFFSFFFYWDGIN